MKKSKIPVVTRPYKTNLHAVQMHQQRAEYSEKLRSLEGNDIPYTKKNPIAAAVQMVVQGRLGDLKSWFETKHQMWTNWIDGLVISGLVDHGNDGNSICWYDMEANMNDLMDPNRIYC